MVIPALALASLVAATGLRVGERSSLAERVPVKGRAVLVFLDNTGCDIATVRDELGKAGVAVVAVVGKATCRDLPRDPRIVSDSEYTGTVGVLLDEQGVVRRVVREKERLPREVGSWLDGKRIYDAQCARCHGPDGKDTSYPDIKSLDGIGSRMDEAEILRRTELTGAVDMSGLTDTQRRALAVYVAGL